jgi:hypothetical protein
VNTGRIGFAGCTFNFPGNVFQWTGGQLNAGVGSTNVGIMNLTNSPVLNGGNLYNNNLMNLADNSSLNCAAGFLNNNVGGTFNIQGNSSLVAGGGGQVNNYGLFKKSAGTGTSQIIPTFNNYGGTIEADAGTLALNVNNAGYYTNVTFVVSNGAAIDFLTSNYNGQIEGNLTGSGGGTVLMNNGQVGPNYGATLNFPGAMFQWQGGKFSNVTNAGTINVSGPVGISGSFFNNGTMIQSGTGSSTGGNNLYNNTGAVYDIQNDNGISINYIYNYGRFKKSAGAGTSLVSANFINYGPNATVEVDTGTIALGLNGGNLFTNTSLVVSNGATLDLFTANTTTEIEGSFAGSGGGTVLMTNGTVSSSFPVTLSFPGSMFQWAGGQMGNGNNTLVNIGTLNVSGPVGVNTYLANSGTMIQSGTGGISSGNANHIYNYAGAIYDIQNDNGISLGSINNSGLFKKSAGAGTSLVSANFINYGPNATVEVDTGTLALNGGNLFTNAAIVVSNGATLDLFTANTTTEIEGYLNGSGGGTVLMTNGTLNCNYAGTMNFPGPMFQWQGGQIGYSATSSPLLTNAGTLNISGPVRINGYLANDGTMIQSGLGAIKNGGSGLKNDGLYQIQNDNGVTNGQYFSNYGLLTKTAGSGVSVINGAFNNYGAIQATSGTLQFVNGEFDQYAGTLQLIPAITFGSSQDFYLKGGTVTGVGTLGYTGGYTVHLNGGVLAPGNPFGVVNVPGYVSMNSSGALNIVLGGPGQFSQLTVKNNIQLGGTLNVMLVNGYTPAIGTQFEIITNGGTSSSFATVNVPHGISMTYSNAGVYLTVTGAVPAQVVSQQVSGGNFTFGFGTYNGQSYTVEQNTNLAMPNWTFYTNIIGNGLPYQLTLPVANKPGSFFRVREP